MPQVRDEAGREEGPQVRLGSAIPLSALLLAGLPFGCAPMRGASGFHEVQETVRRRSGLEVTWDRQPTMDPSVQSRIQTLLEKELTAEGAIEVALLSSRRLQTRFEDLEIARAEMVQSWLPRNPLLASELRFPGRPSRPFEVALTQSLLDLIQLRMRRRLAEAAFEPAKLRAADEVLTFVTEVRGAHYTLQAAEQAIEMHGQIVEAARAAAELAIRQHEVGNISDLDLEDEQALFEQAKLDLEQSESEALADRERLNSLLGLWGQQTEWRIAPALPDLPPEEPDLEGVETVAVSQRLDLLAAQHEIEVASRALPLARSTAIGDVSVGVHHEKEPEGTKTTGPALDVPVPIFNRGRAARAKAEAQLRQSQQRYAALAIEIRSEVRAARNQLLSARSRAEYYRDVIVPRRERIVALSQRYYNYMLLGNFQLLLARQNEIEARKEYIRALRDYWTGRSELERAVGGRLASVLPVSSPSPVPEPSEPGKPDQVEHEGHDGGRR